MKATIQWDDADYPRRQKLPHMIPPWVHQGARHFVTINCQKRGFNALTNTPSTATALLESASAYEQLHRWYVWLMLIMPDHVHAIVTFDLDRGIRRTMAAWKSYQTKTLRIQWQSDFFEHRLRNDAEYVEKASYIRMNPVRQGLVSAMSEWPYVIDRVSI